jgi:hypothetical protein
MLQEENWRIEYTHEIEHAFSALRSGNEGLARVCARRAAGIILGEYLSRQGYPLQSSSAYERLTVFISLPDIDPYYQDIAKHFLLKVDTEHKLPEGINLINDVKWLAENLLLETTH